MKNFTFSYQAIDDLTLLSKEQQELMLHARKKCVDAYAPYSNFLVSAVVLLSNGQKVEGVNIENASYPVGICAERSALSSALSSFPCEKIKTLAISYEAKNGQNDQPIFPCGMCRQFILECELRNGAPIEIILSGQKGQIVIIEKAKDLLPFGFDGSVL